MATPASLLIVRRREALFINRTAFICSGFCVKTWTSLLNDHVQNFLLVSHTTPPGFLLSWRGRDRESSGEIESKQQKERARDRRPRRERERNQVRRGRRGGERWVRENMAALPLGFPTLHLRPSCVPNLSTLFPLLGCLLFQFPPASSQTLFSLPVMG